MRILVVDEDKKDMPILCDGLRQLGHQVEHVTDWRKLESVIPQFNPEGIVLDLMMPAIDLPQDKCVGGYTTGAYIYMNVILRLAVAIPFVVLTAASVETEAIRGAINGLRKCVAFKGCIEKGCDEEKIVEALSSTTHGGK